MEHITPTEFIESLDSTEFTSFLKQVNSSSAELLSITLPIAGIDPLAALELNPTYQEKFYWNHPTDEISISAAGKVRELKSTGKNRFEDIEMLGMYNHVLQVLHPMKRSGILYHWFPGRLL